MYFYRAFKPSPVAESGTPHLTEKDIRLCLMSSACWKGPAAAGLIRRAELSTYVQSFCYRSLTNHSSWKIMSSTSPQQRSFSLIRCASLQNCSPEQYMHRQAGSCTKKSNKKERLKRQCCPDIWMSALGAHDNGTTPLCDISGVSTGMIDAVQIRRKTFPSIGCYSCSRYALEKTRILW